LAAVFWVGEDVILGRRVERLDVGHRHAADTEEATYHEVAVAGTQALVGEAVDEEVDTGVQVSTQRRVEVDRPRKYVRLVGQQHDYVRRPADAESDEDDEDHLDLPDRLDNRRLSAPCSQTAAAAMTPLHDAQLGSSDVDEDAPVTEDDDDERKEHSDGDVEQRVVVRPSPVPETLLRLAVERVCRPAGVARNVERHADQPRGDDHREAGAPGKEPTVGGVMADVDVAVDAD